MTQNDTHAHEFRSLAESLPDVVARYDRTLRYVYINERITTVTSMPRETFLGKTNRELGMPEEMVARWEEALRRAFETGEIQRIEFAFPSPTDLLHFESRLVPEFGPDGTVRTVLGIHRDISEIKRADEKLQRSEERYALAQRAAGIGSWDWNVLTGELHWSDQIEPMFGFEEGQFGRTYEAFLACVHPADRQDLENAVNACVRGEIEYEVEHRIVWPDGSVRWISEVGTVFRDDTGRATRMVGLVQDITERRALEEALKLNEERLNALLMLSEQAPEMTEQEIVVFALEEAVALTGSQIGYLHFVNPDQKTLRLVTWSQKTLEACEAAYTPHYPIDQAGVWADCVRLGKPVMHNDYPSLAGKHGLPEGHVPLYRHLNVPVFDGGKATMILGVGNKGTNYTDGDVLQMRLIADGVWQIVQRRRTEVALRESETRLRRLIESANDVVTLRDVEGRYLYFNSPSRYGLAPEYMIGKTPYDVYRPEEADAVSGMHRAVLGTRESVKFEQDIQWQGETLTFSTDMFPVHDESGELAAVGTIAHNITDRKRMEEALEQSREDLQQFAHTVSHDLQEPLRTARGFLDLLVRRHGPTLDAEAHEYIEYVVDGAARMERMIKALLDYSRITTRGRPLEPADAGRALEEVLRDLQFAIMETGATVTFDPLPAVMADEAQLCRVFQNLIGNALKFRRTEAPAVHVWAEPEGDEWRFAVRDNGIGIAPAHFERIFQVFYRLHPRDDFEGTGIGLASCKKIVERHGGRIWVESTQGEGSAFYFTMPRTGDQQVTGRVISDE